MPNIFQGPFKDEKGNSIDTLSKLPLNLCFVIFWEKQLLMSFFIQDFRLNFHSSFAFQHRSGSSVKAIMPLSATLTLAIGLKCFWFLMAFVIPKDNHTWIIFP